LDCPNCGFRIESLPCWRCAEEALSHELQYNKLIKEFSLVRGAPETNESRASLESALTRIHARVRKERFEMTVSYKTQDLLRSKSWWYVPYRWIGCNGFIVNTDDDYVNWLGSALPLHLCFWGHEHGVVADLIDFSFSPDTDLRIAARLLPRFKHMLPNARGALPSEPVWYRESEIPSALARQFPVFRRHLVWYAIPELLLAYENEGIRFTCSLSA